MNPSKKVFAWEVLVQESKMNTKIFENSAIIEANLDQDLCKENGLRQIRPKIDPYLENIAYIHIYI